MSEGRTPTPEAMAALMLRKRGETEALWAARRYYEQADDAGARDYWARVVKLLEEPAETSA